MYISEIEGQNNNGNNINDKSVDERSICDKDRDRGNRDIRDRGRCI